MPADVDVDIVIDDSPPRQRRRLSSPEIQVTRHVVNGHEVIEIGDSDDEGAGAGPSRARVLGDRRMAMLRARSRMRDAQVQAQSIWEVREDEEAGIVPVNLRILSPPPMPPNAPPPPPPPAEPLRLGGALLSHAGRAQIVGVGRNINTIIQRLFGGGARVADAPAAIADLPVPPVPLPLHNHHHHHVHHHHHAPGAPALIPLYQPRFTHPEKLAPGFTHSFPSPPSPDPKGKGKGRAGASPPTVNFVCSRCSDPLYLAAPDHARRVYGLRCGHLLDGKCVAALSTPPADIFPALHPMPLAEVLGAPETPKKAKGKGKGRAPPKGRGRKRKRDEPEVEVPEGEWEWACPVSGCGRGHWSVWDWKGGEEKRGGWVPRKLDGAILLYI